MTIYQLLGLGFLGLFGWGFDRYVAAQQRTGMGDFTARFVIFGCGVILVVQMLDSAEQHYTAWLWGAWALAHFAAGGLGMTLGSWRRMQV